MWGLLFYSGPFLLIYINRETLFHSNHIPGRIIVEPKIRYPVKHLFEMVLFTFILVISQFIKVDLLLGWKSTQFLPISILLSIPLVALGAFIIKIHIEYLRTVDQGPEKTDP